MEHTVRTDLAAEAQRLWARAEADGRLPEGVRFREETLHGLLVQTVEIHDGEAARRLGKAPGRYYSLMLPVTPDAAAQILNAASPPCGS